jgi:hypothetical protein
MSKPSALCFVAYTYRAVSLYRIPGDTTNWRTFRILGWGAIILLLGICILSIYDPMELGDSARRVLAWAAGVIVLLVVVLAMVLSSRGGLRKLKEGFQFELSNGKITQMSEGRQTVEIPLAQIESLHEYPGWLVIRGGQPARHITIPSEVNGFEELKRELTAYRAIKPLKARIRLFSFFPLVLLIVACFYFFTSHNGAIILAAGGAVLLLQGLGFYSIWRLRRNLSRPKLLLLVNVLTWLVTAWIVYERAKGAM